MTDIIVKISDSATVKATNNVVSYSFSVQSNVVQDTKEAYNDIIPIMSKIRKLLIGSDLVEDLKTDYRVDTIMEYKPKRKILGYQATGNVTFDTKLNNGDQANIFVSGLQESIMNLSNDEAKVFINDVKYTLSEKRKKKVELEAIKKAILYAKRKAQLIVETTYAKNYYTVVKMDVNTNGHQFAPAYRSREMAMMDSQRSSNVVSQGVSEIKADVAMEISVTK